MKTFFGALAASVVMTAFVHVISANPVSPRPAFSAVDIPAGPIWNNADAKVKCPVACAAASLRWNGQWNTVIAGKQSVCGCE